MKLKALLFPSLIFLLGCGPAVIDGSSKDSFAASIKEITKDMTEDEKKTFASSLMVLTVGESGNIFNADPSSLHAELNGMTAAQVLSKAEAVKAKREAAQKAEAEARAKQERERAIQEIKELEDKQSAAAKAQEALKAFKISRSRFFKKDQRFGGPKPYIELTVTNNTKHAISRAYFVGTLATPGRSIPWLSEDFNYSIPGGLEAGESQSWTLAPNQFSKWGTTNAPKDAVFTVRASRLDDANNAPLFNAEFSERDTERLAKLRDSVK